MIFFSEVKNKMSYFLVEAICWASQRSVVNSARVRQNMDPIVFGEGELSQVMNEEIPWSFLYSPAVLPKCDDWRDNVQVTGFIGDEGGVRGQALLWACSGLLEERETEHVFKRRMLSGVSVQDVSEAASNKFSLHSDAEHSARSPQRTRRPHAELPLRLPILRLTPSSPVPTR